MLLHLLLQLLLLVLLLLLFYTCIWLLSLLPVCSAGARLVELEVDRGLDWDHAMTRYHNYKDTSAMTGFYVSKRDMFGHRMFILITPKDNSSHLFHVARSVIGGLVHWFSYRNYLVGLVVKASALRVEDPGFESRLRWHFFRVKSYQWLKKLALEWLPCQAPGIIGSRLGLVSVVSVYYDRVR